MDRHARRWVSKGPCARVEPSVRTDAPKEDDERAGCAEGSHAATSALHTHTLPRVARDGAEHPGVSEAAAEHRGQRLADLRVARLRMLVQECLRGQDDAAQAESALRGLLLDERALDRVRSIRGAEALEGGDLRSADGGDRHHTRPGRAAVDEHGARSALAEAAAELRAAEREIVAEDVEERGGPVGVEDV